MSTLVPTSPIAVTFGALGDGIRCAIVERLARTPEATVNELAGLFPVSLQAVSKHLKVLEAAGLITQRRDGRHRPVSLRPEAILTANTWLDRRTLELEQRFARLDDLLADLQEDHTR